MAAEIVMPKLGMSMEHGTVMQWHKRPGDPVEKGEPLVAISSEKIEYEIEAPEGGVLLEILVPEEEVVPYGTVIGYVGQPGERWNGRTSGHLEAAPAAVSGGGPGREERIKISPAARKMARSAGIDVSLLVGSGPGGRITVEDVQRAMAGGTQAGAADPKAPEAAEAAEPADIPSTDVLTDTGQVSRIPLRGMRKVIAQRMHASLTEAAQLTLTARADVTRALKVLRELGEEWGQDEKPTVTDLVARAAVSALRKHPDMNSRLVGGYIEIHASIHLGIAVALDKGLVVPVIRGAERMSFGQLSAAIRTAGRRARSQELDWADMEGSTFTVTNLGQYGIEWFTPILNPPETGILGVGMAEDTPVYCADGLERRTLLPLSLTFDHRVVDGAPAAQFLGAVKWGLEHPLALLVV